MNRLGTDGAGRTLTENDAYKDLKIVLQIRNDKDSYDLFKVTEILAAKDDAGQSAFIYICADGKRFIRSLITDDERQLSDQKLIYSSPQQN